MTKLILVFLFLSINSYIFAQNIITPIKKNQSIFDLLNSGREDDEIGVDFSQSFKFLNKKTQDTFSVIVSNTNLIKTSEGLDTCVFSIIDDKYDYYGDKSLEGLNDPYDPDYRYIRPYFTTEHAYDAHKQLSCKKINAVSFLQIYQNERPIILYSYTYSANLEDSSIEPQSGILCYNGTKYSFFYNDKIGDILYSKDIKSFIDLKFRLKKYFVSINYRNKTHCK